MDLPSDDVLIMPPRPTPGLRILALPMDILLKILSTVNVWSLLRFTETCKYIYELVRGTSSLVYKIELAELRLCNGAPSTLTSAERLESLRARRKAWLTPRFTLSQSHSLPKFAFSRDHYALGVYAKLGGSSSGTCYSLVVVNTTTHDPETTVQIHNLRTFARDFAIDPSQNLVALFRPVARRIDTSFPGSPLNSGWQLQMHFRIELRRLDVPTSPHPEAIAGTLMSGTVTGLVDNFPDVVEIADDVIGLFTCTTPSAPGEPYSPSVFIWNWKTSQLLATVISSESVHSFNKNRRFSFVTPRSFVLGLAHNMTHRSTAEIELYTFKECSGPDPAAIELVTILQLPDVTGLQSGVEPTIKLSVAAGPWITHPPTSAPFIGSNAERLVAFNLEFISLRRFWQSLIVIRAGNLVQLMEDARRSGQHKIHMRDWIPSHALLIPTLCGNIGHLHGQHFAATLRFNAPVVAEVGALRQDYSAYETLKELGPHRDNDNGPPIPDFALQFRTTPLEFHEHIGTNVVVEEDRVVRVRKEREMNSSHEESHMVDVYQLEGSPLACGYA